MMTHEQKTRLGIFLALATIIFLVVVGFFLVPKLRETGDSYYIDFRKTSVNGLFLGSSVRYQGVDIGRVTKIEVNPKDMDSIFVYIKVQSEFPIKKDTTALLTYAGITGIKYLDLKGGSHEAERLPRGGMIQMGHGIEEKAGDIVTNIDTAVIGLNSLLSTDNLQRITAFLENVKKSSQDLSAVLDAKRGKLEKFFDNIEKASTEFASVTENLHAISTNVSDMSQKIMARSETAIDNIGKRFSDEELGKVVKNLNALIDTTSASLRKMETTLITHQDELGRALQNLTLALDNLSRFTREISEDPTALIRVRKEKNK